MKSVSSIVFFKPFTETTCENWMYYICKIWLVTFAKRLEYCGKSEKHCFLVFFGRVKIEIPIFRIDKVFTNLLNTPYILQESEQTPELKKWSKNQ